MDFQIKSGAVEKTRSACIITAVYEKNKLSPSATTLDKASGGYLSNVIKRGDISGKAGETLLLQNVPGTTAERILLVGCGAEGKLSDKEFRRCTLNAINALKKTGAKDAYTCLPEVAVTDRDSAWNITSTVLVAEDSLYIFDQMKSKKTTPAALKKLVIALPAGSKKAAADRAVANASASANGINFTRDLGNLPGNVCTPTYLATQAKSLQKAGNGLKVKVLNEAQMEKLGMGSLLSVSRGSSEPAKLIVMEYMGKNATGKPVVLVGKGVTFDTGGISIKPSPQMDEMKYDMCGAASVLGTLKALVEMQAKVNVVGIIPATENMPGGSATKPGDIVTSMSGQTIEILNTDAEGRLILCDALTYAEKNYKPSAVIDIATLTGACVIALGKHATGLLSNNDALAADLLEAGRKSSDRAWQLPLWDEYQQQIKSPFADMQNIGGRDAGTITAACFLSRFTKNLNWAHLDIAGTAWNSGHNKGATGRPVSLLLQYALDHG